MNQRCWNCKEELPEELKPKRLLCDKCKREIEGGNKNDSDKTNEFRRD